MSDFHDIEKMLEILDLAIARQEAEEQFFRRSAQASTSEVARSLFNELADSIKNFVFDLEKRKQKLLDAHASLVMAKSG